MTITPEQVWLEVYVEAIKTGGRNYTTSAVNTRACMIADQAHDDYITRFALNGVKIKDMCIGPPEGGYG